MSLSLRLFWSAFKMGSLPAGVAGLGEPKPLMLLGVGLALQRRKLPEMEASPEEAG